MEILERRMEKSFICEKSMNQSFNVHDIQIINTRMSQNESRSKLSTYLRWCSGILNIKVWLSCVRSA